MVLESKPPKRTGTGEGEDGKIFVYTKRLIKRLKRGGDGVIERDRDTFCRLNKTGSGPPSKRNLLKT